MSLQMLVGWVSGKLWVGGGGALGVRSFKQGGRQAGPTRGYLSPLLSQPWKLSLQTGNLELGRDARVQRKHKSCLGAGPGGPWERLAPGPGRDRAAEFFVRRFSTGHSLSLPLGASGHLQRAQLACPDPAPTLDLGQLSSSCPTPTVHVFTRGNEPVVY